MGILQARILKWVAMPSRGSSRPRDSISSSYIAGRFFTTEPQGSPVLDLGREKETKERKEECEKRLEEIELLEEKVEDIPAKVEEAGKEGAREREFLINKANKYQTELSNKTEELRIGSLQTEYDRLLKKYEALEQDAANLSKRLDQCNMESRKLTSDTVRFIGGINILNPDTHQFNEAGGKNK